MKYIKVTEVDTTGKQTYCRKCGKPHAILKYEGQAMQIGNVQIYNSVRYSCICGFPATWFASPIKDATKGFDDEAGAILNGLGASRKYQELNEKRRKKGDKIK
jgi:hypothetical protein